jgi:hypothetical protein
MAPKGWFAALYRFLFILLGLCYGARNDQGKTRGIEN